MTAPLYDLMLLLSTSAEDDRRAKILSDVDGTITGAGGSIERNDDWGTRALSYQIEHQADAHYHLLQFKGPPALLETLSHNLKIDDAVLRFRIIKVLPGTPPPPDPRPAVAVAAPVEADPDS
jgi:small subunit ribosomal protein S6